MAKEPKERRNISLDPSVDAILDRVDNASEYVQRLVLLRDREWRRALVTLRAAGWTAPALLAACDALNGIGLLDEALDSQIMRSGSALALELEDAQRLDGICAKWDVPPERWRERVLQLASDQHVANALYTVTTEFWSMNESVEDAIRGA